MTINKNQMAVLKSLAGVEKYKGQSNHWINGRSALVRRGLAQEVQEIRNGATYYTTNITEAGISLINTAAQTVTVKDSTI